MKLFTQFYILTFRPSLSLSLSLFLSVSLILVLLHTPFFSHTLFLSLPIMKYVFVSVPALGDKQNTFLNIKGKLAEYAQTYHYTIPEFKVYYPL